MSKQSLLLVDGDTRSLRVLEVSLRKAGFSVTPAVSVGDALDKLEINPPDLIISETKFATELDGFELRRRLRGTPEWAEIPFIFLTAETAIENKIKGLELGVDDYLTKPIYIKEIVTRINILLQKRQRQFLDLRKDGTRFAGRVADMPVVDVIQTIEVSRKSGVIQFSGGPNRQAAIYFRDGKVIDAEAGTLQGEDAVYRLLTWSEGEFEVEFRTVRRREVIEASSQGLLMEGMRRLDEWSRLLEQLPALSHRFEIDAVELSTRLGEVPDDNNRILRLFDSKRTLLEVIDASDFGDLECLQAISRLYFEGLLIDLDPAVRPPRETGKPMPIAQADDSGQTPMQAASSGAIDLIALETRASEPKLADSTTTTTTTAAPSQPPAAMDSTAPVEATDVMSSEPLASPTELAADMPRGRRDSSQAIDEGDVVAEEEVHGPLAGGYRQSSLRLIDEAVAAAQLIEPSLFADDELAALGIKRATPEELAAAQSAQAAAPAEDSQAAAIARVKLELRTADPRIETARDLVEKTPADGHGSNGRPVPPVRKSMPPPIPMKAQEIEEAPLLDSDLLQTSGEFRIPSDAELADAELLDADLLTSGEHKIPSDAELARPQAPPVAKSEAAAPPAPPKTVTMGWDAQPEPEPEPAPAAEPAVSAPAPAPAPKSVTMGWDAQPEPEPATAEPAAAAPAPAPAGAEPSLLAKTPTHEDDSAVPTPIEAETDGVGADLADEGPTDPSRRRLPTAPMTRPDEPAVKMINSLGRDRAEASGELRPPSVKTGDPGQTQRELVTIMPRRKTGEVAQLRPEDVATLDAKGQAKAKSAVEAIDAAAVAKAAADVEAEETKAADTAEIKPAEVTAEAKAAAKPALEPPRRVSVEGGVVVPQRGPGLFAIILMILASVVAGVAVFSYFKKSKSAKPPVVTTDLDAGSDRIVMTEPLDAEMPTGFGVDASIEPRRRDAAIAMRPDAAVAVVRPDAAVAVVRPDAAVAMVRPDAAVIVTAPDDGAVATVDKGKEAAALAKKARAALAEGEPQAALDLFDQALKLRRDKRTYVDRGRALHNLGRTDEAVASIDEAIKMSDGYAPAWEQKGLILWSAQRYGDARPALERYLELSPDGPKSETIRKMLDEPR